MFDKLLCAVDGSHSSQKAAALAAALAERLGAKLTFLTVQTMDAEHAAKDVYWDSQLLGAAELQTERELEEARNAAASAGLEELACVKTYGRSVAEAIVAYAEKEGFQHIVTGSSGRSGVGRMLLGSVAADVVAKAHCPVTVAR